MRERTPQGEQEHREAVAVWRRKLLPFQAVGLGAPQTIIRCACVCVCVCVCVCHCGHYKALSRCQLVGSFVRPGENFFPKAYDHIFTLDTVTGNLDVNRSMRDTNKFHFFSFSRNSISYNNRYLCHGDQNISWWRICRLWAVNFEIHL